jgi:hypothetical protein
MSLYLIFVTKKRTIKKNSIKMAILFNFLVKSNNPQLYIKFTSAYTALFIPE